MKTEDAINVRRLKWSVCPQCLLLRVDPLTDLHWQWLMRARRQHIGLMWCLVSASKAAVSAADVTQNTSL